MVIAAPEPKPTPLAYELGQRSVRYPTEDSQVGNKTAATEKLKEVSAKCAQPTLYALLTNMETSMNCLANEIDPCCTEAEHEMSMERLHGYSHNMLGGSTLVDRNITHLSRDKSQYEQQPSSRPNRRNLPMDPVCQLLLLR